MTLSKRPKPPRSYQWRDARRITAEEAEAEPREQRLFPGAHMPTERAGRARNDKK